MQKEARVMFPDIFGAAPGSGNQAAPTSTTSSILASKNRVTNDH
jgi:hypothetical protein